MIEFLQRHPDYLLLFFLILFAIIKVMISIVQADDHDTSNDDDDSGGILEPDPILDLPPGVSLPTNKRSPELVD